MNPVKIMQPFPTSDRFYTPNHVKWKLLMVLIGCVVLSFGSCLLWIPLRLVIFGKRTKAEATCVIKCKEGIPACNLTNDVQIQANLETRDRSYIFWNEFRFHTADGQAIDVRAPVGSIGKPLYTLMDSDGLPTTDLVYYDPAKPESIVFPLIVITWLVPVILILIGSACAGIGAILLYWAKKPIELPHIPSMQETAK